MRDIYDIEKLKLGYERASKYLRAYQNLKDFNLGNEKLYEKKKTEIITQLGIDKLEKEEDSLLNKINELEGLIEYDIEYDEDFDGDYNNLTDAQIDEYFDSKKALEHLKRKITHKRNELVDILELFDKNKPDKDELLKKENELSQAVINAGLSMLDSTALKTILKEYDKPDEALNTKTVNEMFLNNTYYAPYDFAKDGHKDYSAGIIRKSLLLSRVFDNLEEKYLFLNNSRLIQNFPSTLEYFILMLNKHIGKEFEIINIITNQKSEEYWEWRDCLKSSDCGTHYSVYGATLILPKYLAEVLKLKEKWQTAEKIERLAEQNQNVFILYEGDLEYGFSDGYHDKKPNFTEEAREKCRAKLAKQQKSNQLAINELFGIKEYGFLNNEIIVGSMISKEIADAMFETLEYANKLYKVKKVKPLKEKQDKMEQAKKEYEALMKSF